MARKAQQSRAESLDRALSLFWKQGYHATSLKDLERALDMHPGSIYAAFGSKNALFLEALERYATGGQREFERMLAGHGRAVDALADYVRELGRLREVDLPSRACMLTKSLLELYEAEPALRIRVETLLAAMEALFVATFERARERGEIALSCDPERLGRRMQVYVMGLRSYALREGDGAALREVAEDIALEIERLRQPPGARGAN